MKKVAFYTLGCKLNYSETSAISRSLEQRGFKKADFRDKPDVYIINTCSVTENADKKCRKVVKEARKHSPNAFVAIIGCYAQLKPKAIADIPGVDAVLGAAEKFMLPDLLGTFERQEQPQILASGIEKANTYHTAYSLNDRTRTFLKVQDGCNYGCAFCTIPLARGKSRSDSISNIVKAAEDIATRSEVKEIVLTGVNIGDFGVIEGRRQERFADLVQALDKVKGIERFRISSIEPNLLSNEIISFVARSDKFVPHFHIPLQSGSDKILTAMRRRYRRNLYTDRVAHIKKLMPHCCIGVDVIVGFPGETDEDFMTTYQYLNELDISYLHVFTYSERDNTDAVKMANPVPSHKRAERSKMLHILSDKKRRAFYEQQKGGTFTVLYEADIKDYQMQGFTENYVRVTAPYDPLLINETQAVKIENITPDMLAEVTEVSTTVLLPEGVI